MLFQTKQALVTIGVDCIFFKHALSHGGLGLGLANPYVICFGLVFLSFASYACLPGPSPIYPSSASHSLNCKNLIVKGSSRASLSFVGPRIRCQLFDIQSLEKS